MPLHTIVIETELKESANGLDVDFSILEAVKRLSEKQLPRDCKWARVFIYNDRTDGKCFKING